MLELKAGPAGEAVRGAVTVVLAPKAAAGLPHAVAATPRSPAAVSDTTAATPAVAPSHPALNADEHGWLPPGWERRTDKYGHAFYIDHNTRTTTWVRPPTNVPATEIERRQIDLVEQQRRLHQQRSLPGAGVSSAEQALRGLAVGEDGLPPGWERRMAPNGQFYYIDHTTQRTTWVRPTPAPQYAIPPSGPDRLLKIYQASVAQLGELPQGWEMREQPNGQIYFVDHNTHSTTWDDPRLPSSADAACPEYKRNFQQKLAFFRVQPDLRMQKSQTYIDISRANVFMDAYEQFMKYSPDELRRKLTIRFDREEGLDYGGVAREFFFLLSHEMFNPIYCLFEYSSHGKYTLQICPRSDINPEHLEYFRFIGRAVGVAIFHQRFLDAFFVSAFYKQVLGMAVTPEDLESIDPELWRGISWMQENDVAGLMYTFSVDDERFGEIHEHELKPNGKDIEVTNENKHEYIQLLTQWRVVSRVKTQMDAFMHGLFEIIPKRLLSIFDDRELELLIGGVSELDMADWKKYTDYRNCEPEHPIVQWFWKALPILSKSRSICSASRKSLTRSRRPSLSSSSPARRASPSTALRACRAPTAPAASPSRLSRATLTASQWRTRASTASIFPCTPSTRR